MKAYQIEQLARHGLFCRQSVQGKVEETHISWVILSGKNAFKIKKPLKLPFLDFSTLHLRKYFCNRELVLNSRFSDIYQDVIPVQLNNGRFCLGKCQGKVVDYAVQMKRLMTAKRLDNVLRSGKPKIERIRLLAESTALFHHRAEIVHSPFNIKRARDTFNDIRLLHHFIQKAMGAGYAKRIARAVQWSDDFLSTHARRLQQRIDSGFKRDVHGDLHSGNIFLYRKPVLFDCIEFNDVYRQIDLLYEVAFLCMDFESFNQPRLADLFFKVYNKNMRCIEVEEDKRIFNYFKCLRANVRAKVHAMRAMQRRDSNEARDYLDEVRRYLLHMKEYMGN
ncbi:MAG: hypothetical protein OEV74_19270 [Cyclobacteriaceae bacterium]|nr:hypothetical protein [Cyclobacteriaceae bacterium]MDH4298425.1 hypothetical protein [Cyclobacteriaceae bacterium]MDH5248233.1 hypothetical protein [Cyclobacteriaceae bacterium]